MKNNDVKQYVKNYIKDKKDNIKINNSSNYHEENKQNIQEVIQLSLNGDQNNSDFVLDVDNEDNNLLNIIKNEIDSINEDLGNISK